MFCSYSMLLPWPSLRGSAVAKDSGAILPSFVHSPSMKILTICSCSHIAEFLCGNDLKISAAGHSKTMLKLVCGYCVMKPRESMYPIIRYLGFG